MNEKRALYYPTSDAHVRVLVDMERAEACEIMGEHERALAFVQRHL